MQHVLETTPRPPPRGADCYVASSGLVHVTCVSTVGGRGEGMGWPSLIIYDMDFPLYPPPSALPTSLERLPRGGGVKFN